MTPEIVHDCHEMITGMRPELREGSFVFVSPEPELARDCAIDALAMFVEDEGRSFILPTTSAARLGLDGLPMRCITLRVYSALDGVGLTAAVASALAHRRIPCNMVAACHHDHAFVPEHMAGDALRTLLDLQAAARALERNG